MPSSFASLNRGVLRALLDRLIPADDFPGATQAGVEGYLLKQWSGDCAAEANAIFQGLERLNEEASARFSGSNFLTLTAEQKDFLLHELEAGRPTTRWAPELPAGAFLDRLIHLAHEGFYADPGNGGNRDAAAWRMVGYDPRLPSFPVVGLPFTSDSRSPPENRV